MTAMTGKGAEDSREKFAEILVRAVKQIQENGKADLRDIKIEKIKGDGIKDTELISGIVFEKEKISHDMPSICKKCKNCSCRFPA